MDKKLLINYFYNILYQVISVLAPLITVPYTTRIIGDTNLGVNAFTTSFVQWFVIFGIMGINNYGIRTIGMVRDNRKELSETFLGIYMMQAVNMLLVILAYFTSVGVLSLEYKNIYIMQGFSLLTSLLDVSWFFIGIEDFKVASLRNILVKLGGVVCIFLFVKGSDDFVLYIIINILSSFLGNLTMFLALRNKVDFCRISVKEAYQKHFKNNLILFIPQIATSVYNIMDQTLVGLLAVDWEVQSAYYQQATRIVKMFLYFITSIGTVMLPRIANAHHKGESAQISSYLSITYKMALYLSIPLMFGIAAVAPCFIPWYLDEKFVSVGRLIVVCCPIIVLISMSNVFGTQYLLPVGYMKEYSSSVVIGAAVNLLSNLLLIPRFGALGACIAVVAAEFSVTFSQIIFVKGKLKLDIEIKSYVAYIVSGLLMAVVVYLIGMKMGARMLTNIIQVAAGVLVYFASLFVFKEEFHLFVVNKVLEMLHFRKVKGE